jgi:hypothetical protein
MALTERQEYKVEVIPPYSVLQVRRADIIERDGEEIARSYHRHSLTPGSDYSAEPAVVRAIALSLWSPALATAYENQTEAPGYMVDASNYIPDWWTLEQKAAALQELLAELSN